MSKDIAKIVTDRIIDAMKNGVVPWAKPWASVGAPRSVHGHRYRGVNTLILTLASMTEGYTSPFWVTYKQAVANGWRLKDAKGKGVAVVLFKPVTRKSDSGDEDDDGEDKQESFLLMRYYVVFNLDLVEVGEDSTVPLPVVPELGVFDPIDVAQNVIDGMPSKPEIQHAGDMAYYVVSQDKVVLPVREAFSADPADYYAVAFHELAHATGHDSRLGRESLTTKEAWGGQHYAKEELVAELCSAMLCAETGISPNYVRSASYVSSWLRWADDNRREIISAAGQAQKAADWILGDFVPEDEVLQTAAA